MSRLKMHLFMQLILASTFFCIFFSTQALAEHMPGMASNLVFGENSNEQTCFPCHRQNNLHTNEGVVSARAFCLDCHAEEDTLQKVQGQEISLQVPQEAFADDPHQYIACVECHTDVARSPHQSAQDIACLDCHHIHSQGKTHPPHLRVSCQACHFAGQALELDQEQNKVVFSRFDADGQAISLAGHETTDLQDRTFCQKCHFQGNKLGAAASVLPGKSVLCLPCHNAPLRVGSAHGLYWGPLLVALLGFLAMFSLWFKGSFGQEPQGVHQKLVYILEGFWKTIFSRRLYLTLKTIILDIILQRRILEQGVQRWLIHSLIFLGFLGRFALSLFTVLVFNLWPDSSLAEILVNKNHPFVAIAYDFLGLCILAGIIWAAILRFFVRPLHLQSKEQDALALLIIGSVVIVGFILEGMRILLTQTPQDLAVYSFAGYLTARILDIFSQSWQSAYAAFWYLHAALWALFIIYLPFGKLKHILTTPLNLILSQQEKHEEQ